MSGGDEGDAPRGEMAMGNAVNEGSGAMATTSSGGEANELIDEVARSEVNEMGDTMAMASGGGEASEPRATKKKRSRWTTHRKTHNQRDVERRARADGDNG